MSSLWVRVVPPRRVGLPLWGRAVIRLPIPLVIDEIVDAVIKRRFDDPRAQLERPQADGRELRLESDLPGRSEKSVSSASSSAFIRRIEKI